MFGRCKHQWEIKGWRVSQVTIMIPTYDLCNYREKEVTRTKVTKVCSKCGDYTVDNLEGAYPDPREP